jgi:hypothetical protein
LRGDKGSKTTGGAGKISGNGARKTVFFPEVILIKEIN